MHIILANGQATDTGGVLDLDTCGHYRLSRSGNEVRRVGQEVSCAGLGVPVTCGEQ